MKRSMEWGLWKDRFVCCDDSGMFHLPVSGYLGGNFLVEGRSSGRAGIYSAKCTLF